MPTNFRKAFTMTELIFVIVVIGILAAIALPRFTDSADNAYLARAQSEVATIRAALATERQKRVLRSDFTDIVSLSRTSGNADSFIGVPPNVFDHFSADGENKNAPIFQYPVRACANEAARACWTRTATTADTESFEFRFLNASDGEAKFILQNNRFDCNNDAADCQRITL